MQLKAEFSGHNSLTFQHFNFSDFLQILSRPAIKPRAESPSVFMKSAKRFSRAATADSSTAIRFSSADESAAGTGGAASGTAEGTDSETGAGAGTGGTTGAAGAATGTAGTGGTTGGTTGAAGTATGTAGAGGTVGGTSADTGTAGAGAAGAGGAVTGVTTGAAGDAETEACVTRSNAAGDAGEGWLNGLITIGAAFLDGAPVANLGDALAVAPAAGDEPVVSLPFFAASLRAAGITIVLRHFAHLSSFTILSVAGLSRIFAPQLLQTRILSITSSLYSYLFHKLFNIYPKHSGSHEPIQPAAPLPQL
jgi:hypothetical protein